MPKLLQGVVKAGGASWERAQATAPELAKRYMTMCSRFRLEPCLPEDVLRQLNVPDLPIELKEEDDIKTGDVGPSGPGVLVKAGKKKAEPRTQS